MVSQLGQLKLALQVYKPATPDNHRADIIFLRDYRRGIMAMETVLRIAEKDTQRDRLKARAREQRKLDKKGSKVRSHMLCMFVRLVVAYWVALQTPQHPSGGGTAHVS